MQIFVNGQAQETEALTLAELCALMGYRHARIATALNGDFVATDRRSGTRLAAGDHVEIVAPRQGG